ncbi:CoA ester lyase [Nocardioides sp. zg-579]|uniref:CoA ester lyase n=2 Tax=Nocardioides marmotae TaxID=2663857 RepID=A0A6I3J769_9ACTN|nr:CoA ester lyase [Nocardioides marmotae]MCR6030078.1 CoA ester lyase [Gordonia jinghuaiqii]MTB93709.1 CoA ester lyase [Nocardioides marmotae]QKE00054.1 CoA ester lyase [Nocardioides marmotae]
MRRRSALFAPASNPALVLKALASAADEVIIDLEDAVALDAKEVARAAVVDILTTQQVRPRGQVAVRVNAAGTAWHEADLRAIAALSKPPGSIVLPKVEGPEDVVACFDLLEDAGASNGAARDIRAQVLIESARGVAHVREIAGSSGRLMSLAIGYADLAADLGTRSDIAAAAWLPVQVSVLVAARAHGLLALDGPHLAIADLAGLRERAAFLAQLGFDGKWAIHPSHLEPVHAAFTPSDAEVEQARVVLDALDAAASVGAGAVALDGMMVDEAVAAAARRTLSRAGEKA